ncbi:MAG: gyaR, partial [Candidatus Magasanikbacteria bacterium]|nr:gyaR [Candidatus Magasanikbacteria bacterium]
MPFLIAVTRRVPEEGLKILQAQKNFRLRVSPYDRILTRPELLKFVKGADAILTQLTDKIDMTVLRAAGPQLKIVANYAVGFDNIDLAACRQTGVTVTNTSGVLTQAVAEHTIALMMAVGKRLVEADKFSRAGKYKGWAPMLLLGMQFTGKTLGIVGTGRIGSVVAQFAVKGLGMNLIYSDPVANKELEKNLNAARV